MGSEMCIRDRRRPTTMNDVAIELFGEAEPTPQGPARNDGDRGVEQTTNRNHDNHRHRHAEDEDCKALGTDDGLGGDENGDSYPGAGSSPSGRFAMPEPLVRQYVLQWRAATSSRDCATSSDDRGGDGDGNDAAGLSGSGVASLAAGGVRARPVSYTHLTLPTIYSV